MYGDSSAPLASAHDLAGNEALGKLQNRNSAQGNGGLQDLMSQYANGKMSLSDVMAAAKSGASDPNAGRRSELTDKYNQAKSAISQMNSIGMNDQMKASALKNLDSSYQSQMAAMGTADQSKADQMGGFSDQLATDPMTGSKMASEFVQNDGMTKGLFGEGGLQDQILGRMGADRDAVSGRDESYGLTDNDLKAYGQASGNIARQFGQNEQSLGQMLSDRGLGAGASGAAGAQFSGLMGNKNEQLAGLQQQIAQNRISTAKDLATFRQSADNQMAANLGQLGQGAIQNQYGRQLAGSQDNYNKQAGVAGLNMSNQSLQQNVNNEAFKQQQETAFNPLKALAGLAGDGLSAGATAMGKGAGANIGSSLFKPKPASDGGV